MKDFMPQKIKTEISTKIGKVIAARLLPGKDLIDEIGKLCKRHRIKAGFIPTLFGGMINARILNMGPRKDKTKMPLRVEKIFKQPLEYTATGMISYRKGKFEPHIHVNVGEEHKKVSTGHLLSGEIAILSEIVIVELLGYEAIREEVSEIYHLPLLFFKKNN